MPSLLEILAAFKGSKPDLPTLPERPPEWDPEIPVMGDPILANLVFLMQQRQPRIGRLVSKVQSGPDTNLVERLGKSGFKPDEFDRTNLLGSYNPRDRSVFIRPGTPLDPDRGEGLEISGMGKVDNPTMLQVLVHEFAHAKGAEEDEAQKIHKNVDPDWHYDTTMKVVKRLFPRLAAHYKHRRQASK